MAGWTDYWHDWSSPEALKAAPADTLIRALAAALREKDRVHRQTIHPFPEHFHFIPFDRSGTTYPTDIEWLHIYISRCVFGYSGTGDSVNDIYYGRVVDPTGNSGDFGGLENLPFVTLASAPGILGEELLPTPRIMEEFRYWVHQQYRILNLARWFSSPNPNIQYHSAQAKYFDSYLNATYAERLAGLNAATWTNTSTSRITSYMSGYYNLMVRGFPSVNNLWFDNDPLLKFSIDLYVKPQKAYAYFFPAIDQAIENKFLKIGHIPATLKNPPGQYYLDTTTLLEPSIPPGIDYGFQLTGTPRAAILKFDGPQGLAFRDESW